MLVVVCVVSAVNRLLLEWDPALGTQLGLGIGREKDFNSDPGSNTA